MFPTNTLVTPAQQLLVGIAADLTVALPGSDGEPVPGLTALVDVTRADGTVLYTAAAATDNDDGTYSVPVTATDVGQLDLLVAVWKVAGVTRATTAHEVVGGFYFTRADVNVTEQGRASTDGQDHASLRAEVETECERICGYAFVPRYRRIAIDSSGARGILFPDPALRTIRSVRVYTNGTDFTQFTSDEIAALQVDGSGLAVRRDWQLWGFEGGLVIVDYEHGLDRPPADLKRETIRRYRQRSNGAKSGIPDRAVSFTAENGATYRIATATEFTTGDDDIDAVYTGYAFKASRFGIA